MEIMPACHATRAFWPYKASESAWLAWLVVLAALFALASGGPAEARTAKIALVVSGDEQMQADLKELVERFEKDQPLSGDSLGLLQGAQAALARINTALRSRGYYDATITATVDGRPIAEPGALDAIDARPEAEPVSFAFNVASGPRYRIADVAIRPPTAQASLPAIDRAKLGLAPGDPADASAILEAQDKLITELRKEGYALASIKRDVVVNHATREATVTFVAETGPLARMGPVRFSGTDKVDTVWLQRRVPFKEGEPYDPTKVEALRGKLTSLGVFNAVRIKPAATLDANGELPIRRRTDRPAVALDRLRRLLRDPARLRGLGLLDPSQPVRPGREPAADGRAHPYRAGLCDPRHRLCLPCRLPQARLLARRPGCAAGGGRRCARCSTPIRATR